MFKKVLNKFFSFTALGSAALLAACGNGDVQENIYPAVYEPAPYEDTSPIRIAQLVEDASPEVLAVFEYFRTGLEEHIGREVILIEGATHVVGIEAMRAGNLDLMWGSPFVYLLATRDMEAHRLAVTSSAININKTLFITANDNIQTMEDIQGHSLAFVSTSSASGYLYPMYYLMNFTNSTHDELLAGDFFSAVAFSGNQQASVMGVYHGDYDVAAVGNIQFNNLLNAGIINEEDIRIIGNTEIIPFPGYIAAGHLPAELRESIREFILNFDNTDYFVERFVDPDVRFVIPNEAEIVHLRSMVEALNIDLEEQG
ncbi:MAG: phosphate/phosphite/phosphonate ABC transporter substrate-binding protein [Defluviitaleaceae bacterium]|nr:phosphate/phosphite/phosphonate ABC transporter substrate-binding protein [Defluviitaleaceae bacterium]